MNDADDDETAAAALLPSLPSTERASDAVIKIDRLSKSVRAATVAATAAAAAVPK